MNQSDLIECPFCYASILPMANSCCPACRKDIRTAPPENFRYTAAEITASRALPACCVLCGQDTENIEQFTFQYDSHLGDRLDDASYQAFLLLSLVTLGLAVFLLPLFRQHVRKQQRMTYHINLPFCRACLPAKTDYMPITIEGNVFHFKVHKDFKAKLAAR